MKTDVTAKKRVTVFEFLFGYLPNKESEEAVDRLRKGALRFSFQTSKSF